MKISSDREHTLKIIGGGKIDGEIGYAFGPLISLCLSTTIGEFVEQAREMLGQYEVIAVSKMNNYVLHAGSMQAAVDYSIVFDEALSYHIVNDFSDLELIALWGLLRTNVEHFDKLKNQSREYLR